jgi:hypothetical protein
MLYICKKDNIIYIINKFREGRFMRYLHTHGPATKKITIGFWNNDKRKESFADKEFDNEASGKDLVKDKRIISEFKGFESGKMLPESIR